jgi:hypothetical protein
MSATEDHESDMPAVSEDTVSTGAAADSGENNERRKGLPRVLRYAILIINHARHIEKRLIAEINELCPQLPENAVWAAVQESDAGLALAAELDRRAALQNEPNLRSLADCVRLVCLPTPRDAVHFDEYRRVGKALVHAFLVTSRHAEQQLCCDLERFTFGWAALPACTDLLPKGASAALNAASLGSRIAEQRITAIRATVWREAKEDEERRRKLEAEEKQPVPQEPASAAPESIPDNRLIVARLSSEEMKNPKLKDILGPLKGAINTPLPLVEVPHNPGKWISMKDALTEHGGNVFLCSLIKSGEVEIMRSDGAKHSPVYFNKSELDALMSRRKRLIAVRRLSLLTGLPQSVVYGLIASKHLSLAMDPVSRFRDPCVEGDEIDKLNQRLEENEKEPVTGQGPILQVLQRNGIGEELLTVLRGCLDGSFPFALSKIATPLPLLSRIMIADQTIAGIARLTSWTAPPLPKRVPLADVAILLELNPGDVPGLIAQGYLRAAPPFKGQFVDSRSVRRLAEKYISDRALSRRLKVHIRSLRGTVAKNGLTPSIAFKNANKRTSYLWRRAHVLMAQLEPRAKG